MKFFMHIIPPTVTYQEKQVAIRNGKPVFYEPPKLKDAREKLTAYLWKHRPENKMSGPVSLKVMWLFPANGRHRDEEYKTTKPDTDNLQKLLKDCMTECGYWKDDAQVCSEHVVKIWSDHPGIYIEVEQIGASK